MTLKVRILQSLTRLFIILVSLMMSLFSEKMLIFNRCISGLMSNLIKKSWTVSIVQSAVESSSNCSELGIGIEAALSGVVSNKTSLNKTNNNRLVGSAVTHIPASSDTLANFTASNRAAFKSNELLQDQGNLLRGTRSIRL